MFNHRKLHRQWIWHHSNKTNITFKGKLSSFSKGEQTTIAASSEDGRVKPLWLRTFQEEVCRKSWKLWGLFRALLSWFVHPGKFAKISIKMNNNSNWTVTKLGLPPNKLGKLLSFLWPYLRNLSSKHSSMAPLILLLRGLSFLCLSHEIWKESLCNRNRRESLENILVTTVVVTRNM